MITLHFGGTLLVDRGACTMSIANSLFFSFFLSFGEEIEEAEGSFGRNRKERGGRSTGRRN